MIWRPPTLETDRLLIRPLFERDAEAIFAMCSNPNMTRFTLWDTHRSMDDTLHFVRQYAVSRYLERLPEPMAVTLKSEGEPIIGTAGCFWVSIADESMEMGYNVAEPHWGHGYAVEAARKLIEHVFAVYPVQRLQLRIFEGNDGSVRVAEKLGFHLDGILRSALVRYGRRWDVRIYSLLKD
jgi:[ribosomal protein S5]-alanine N-acetyltransferase